MSVPIPNPRAPFEALPAPTLAALGLTFAGNGSPEGVVTAAVSSLYQRTDGAPGTLIYLKTSGAGNTGWTAVA